MVQHHQAAVRMASDYNSDPIANNLLLRRMNNDIMVDQRYEIDFIESVLARYHGDAANVPADPRMVAIMQRRSEEHTSELQSLMRISYAVFCLKTIIISLLYLRYT